MDNILENISKSVVKFLQPLTLEETSATIVQEAMKLVDAHHGTVHLEEKGELRRVYASMPELYQTKIRRKANTFKAYKNREVLIVPLSKIKNAHPEAVERGTKWGIFIPLSYKDKSVGVLTLGLTEDKHISKKQIKGLKLFGAMASLAIKKMQLYSESKEALENKDLFISMAAHELRTPLTTIRGYVELLCNKICKTNTVEARWVKELYAESIRLTLLVNDLLEINRIKMGKVQYVWQECSLMQLVRRVVSNFELNYPQRKFVFESIVNDKQDIVIGDFDKLIQVVTNLLENAVKFSLPEKEIAISLGIKPSYFVLQVKDQGKGIAKKDIPRVFEGFYKGDRNLPEGMGLGLFLAKNIIEEHRGSIHIHSKVNKGTLVEIQLPRLKNKNGT